MRSLTAAPSSISDSTRSGPPAEAGADRDSLPHSTFQVGPDAMYMGLELSGDLFLDTDGCLRLRNVQGEGGPEPIDILWPVGATLSEGDKGRAEVVMPDGSVFARTGPITATGGYGPDPSEIDHPCVDPQGGAYQIEVVLPSN